MNRIILTIASFLLCSFAFNLAFSQSEPMPAGFPVYKDTGNPDHDIKEYDGKKAQWIQANPSAYAKLKESNSSPTLKISQEEFEHMPPAKQQNIRNHPELYIVTKNTDIEKPEGSPIQSIYKVTKEEFRNSSAEKIKYMKEHPEQYDLLDVLHD